MRIDILSLLKETKTQDLEMILQNIEDEINKKYEEYEDEINELHEEIELLKSNQL